MKHISRAAALRRYSRHLLIPEVGLEGQERLAAARALVVGAGGLGTPVLQYLAAAGVGRIGVVDDDVVDETNLQRQVIYATGDVGRPKTEVAAERVLAINPNVAVDRFPLRFEAQNARFLFDGEAVGRFRLGRRCGLRRRRRRGATGEEEDCDEPPH